jgi:hypothetical protein
MHPWVTSIFSNIKLMSILRIFVQYPLMKAVLPLLFSTKSTQEKLYQHGALVTAKLDKRLALGVNSPRKDFLSYILEHNDEKEMSYQELWGNSDVLIVAGSETTATSLLGLTYYLSQNQEVWRRLKIEIRESFRSEDEMTMRSTAALPYLSACLQERLRIYPPVDLTPPRDSLGATINGEYIPKGVSHPSLSRQFLPSFQNRRTSNHQLRRESGSTNHPPITAAPTSYSQKTSFQNAGFPPPTNTTTPDLIATIGHV